jgi:hypothetical protein
MIDLKPRLITITLLTLLVATGAAISYQAHRAVSGPKSLTAYVPQDALVTIESPDFAALLHQWTNSPQSAAWMKSANYSVFQNSRLYSRLGDAQTTYATAAGFPASAEFLNQIAGKQSTFAWYDISMLEFVYITRMPAAQANQTALLQSRAKFERRHAGNSDFYIRSGTKAYTTIAFAQVSSPSGDLLILATREDLIANALKLIAGDTTIGPVTSEPWFHDAEAALPAEKSPPALHMVINLDRSAEDSHFVSYWIQQNITWTRQFRSAVSDLYLESAQFREERALLPKSLDATAQADVTALAALAPPESGVFRAQSTTEPADAVEAIQTKLLGASPAAAPDPRYAPDPTLDTPQSGSTNDLELRIDALPPVTASASAEALTRALTTSGFDALMTLTSASALQEESGIWVPIHSAVVLHSATPLTQQTVSAALQQLLRGQLTASELGIEFRPSAANPQIYAITGPRPLFFATRDNLTLLADDQPLLLQILANAAKPTPKSSKSATVIAAFNHSTQAAPYARLSSLIDGTNHPAIPGANPTKPRPANSSVSADVTTDEPSSPAFFSQNIESISATFAALRSERFTQRPGPANSLHQTVLYQWQPSM